MRILSTLTDVSTFAAVTIALLVGSICWLLKVMTESYGKAMLFAPFLTLGALLSSYMVSATGLTMSADKDTNTVQAAAIGILVALMIVILFYWVSALISEHRVRTRKVSHALDDAAR